MKPWLNLSLVFSVVVLVGCKTGDVVSDAPAIQTPDAVPVIRLTDEAWETERAKNGAAEQRLAKIVSLSPNYPNIVSLPSNNLNLEQLIAFVRDATNANIAVNWPALKLSGIGQDALVTISLNRVPASQLLSLVLDQVSADAFEDDKAGYAFVDGVVKISTRRDLKSETLIGIYDVAWYIAPTDAIQTWLYREDPRAAQLAALLIKRDEDIQRLNQPGFDLNDALSSSSSGGSPRGHGGGGGPTDDDDGPLFGDDVNDHELDFNPVEARIDLLSELIQTTIGDIDEWLDEESTLTAVQNQFIIKTSYENHLAIEKLLVGLHQAQVEQYARLAKEVEVYLLLDKAEQHRLAQEYPSAMGFVNQALRVDPQHPQAKALQRVLKDVLTR